MTRQNMNSPIVDVPRRDWGDTELMETLFQWSERWPNFRPAELACKCCGELKVNYKALDALQRLRNYWQIPLHISSGTRCPKHNDRVGGAKDSYHKKGMAFDIGTPKTWTGKTTASFLYWATHAGFRGIGLYSTFIHLDIGPHRAWESQDLPDPFDRNDTNEIGVTI